MNIEPQTILYIILGIITFDFVFEQILDFINLKAQKKDIPPEMEEFYNRDKYLKSLEYHRILTRYSFVTSAFSLILAFVFLSTGLFGQLDLWMRPWFTNDLYLSLAYFATLFIASDILNTPFQLYSTFVIEQRFGFNKTSPRTFVTDKFKGYLLALLMGGPLIGSLLYLIQEMGSNFWIYFWGIATLFTLFINMFYTSLILPLFNKLKPLEDGELKTAIEAYSQTVKFPLDNIFVIDGSKRSKKANAFFSGLGKKKKVVLYDTLIESQNTDELVAVLAHEVGHYKKKHIILGFATSIIQIGLMLFIMSAMIYNENLSQALGGDQLAVHLNLLAFTILFSPISKITGVLGNLLSRKNEYEADAYATKTFNGQALQNALKRLSVENLSNLYPHPSYVFFHYSHPPLLKRLEAIDKL